MNRIKEEENILIIKLIEEVENTNSSNPEFISNTKQYKKVVNLGEKVIPYLIEREKYIWNIALEELTGNSPDRSLTKSSEISEYWKKWGKLNGY